MYNMTLQFEMIFEGEITNETTLQLATALADLGEVTTPPDDRSSLYAQVMYMIQSSTKPACSNQDLLSFRI